MAAPERPGFAAAPELPRSGWRCWLCLGILAAGGVWALLRFGATASEDLYLTFLAAAAALVAAMALLPRGRWSRVDGLFWSLVVTGLCLQVARLPTFEARGYLRPALGALAVLLVSGCLAKNPRGIRRVAWGLVATGCFEATWGIIGVLQALAAGASSFPAAKGSLLNPNHLASWLNACLALGLGLSSGSRYLPVLGARRDRWGERVERMGRALAAGWMVLAVALTGSRAGLATTALLIAGFTICSQLNTRRERAERGEPADRGRAWGAVVAVALVAVSLALAVVGPVLSGEEVLGLERRIELYQGTLELISDSPWTGSGPGLFAWTFRPYHRFETHKRFRHAHNDLLETAADWGIPVAALLVGLLAWRLSRSWKCFLHPDLPGEQRWLQWGTATALSTFLVHGMVDFSLQIPGHLLLFAWILGLARADERCREPFVTAPASKLKSRLQIAVMSAAVIAVVLVVVLAVLAAASKVVDRWWALEQIRSGDSLPSLERAVRIDPQAPALHFRLGVKLRDDLDHRDLKRAHEHLSRAAELNPLSWRYQYELGAFYEGVGQEQEATAALLAGLALDPHNPAAKQRVAAFFLRRDRPEKALPLLSQAVAAEPELLESIGEMLLRSALPLEEIVDWWPLDGRGVLLRLLVQVAREGSEPWVDHLWGLWLESERPPVEEGSFWVEHLLEQGLAEEARRRWHELLGGSARAEERVWNGDFERALSEGALGWQTSRSPSMEWVMAPGEGTHGSTALRIELQGTRKQDFRRLRQLLVVRPGAVYELRYQLRAVDLDVGLTFLQVVSDGERRPLVEVAPDIGTDPSTSPVDGWVYRVQVLQVPEGVDRAWIRLGLRFPSAADPLSGTLWLDDVSLRSRTQP